MAASGFKFEGDVAGGVLCARKTAPHSMAIARPRDPIQIFNTQYTNRTKNSPHATYGRAIGPKLVTRFCRQG